MKILMKWFLEKYTHISYIKNINICIYIYFKSNALLKKKNFFLCIDNTYVNQLIVAIII